MNVFKQLFGLMAALFISLNVVAQDADKEFKWEDKGKVSGKIFANFHTMAVDEFGENSAFDLGRAYFGYSYKIDEHFSTKVMLDIYKDAALGKRTAFFKNAYLEYNYEQLKVQVGIAGNFQFKTQEKFFGYRYVVKSFQDLYKFGPSADLGVFAYYKASDALTINFSVNNGEGYGVVQNGATNNFKSQIGMVLSPGKVLTAGLYADAKSFSDSSQMSISAFVGANLDPVKVGVEFINQTNHKLEKDHNYWGISACAKLKASDNMNVFTRYDMCRSDELDDGLGGTIPWNIAKDGNYLVGGVEYLFSKNVRMALDYQHQMFELDGADDKGYLFAHLEAKF